jgi:hypothetical protein
MTQVPERILYFHTGTGKTGSTALQAYLEQNRARLADAGVSYVFHPRASHAAGNGRHLWESLFGRHVAPDTLGGILEYYLGGRATAVCSSEDFTGFGSVEWQQLFDVCARQRIVPRTITYVRDVVPYYQSLHAQLCRTGDHYCSLAEFSAMDCYHPVMSSLQCLHELIGRDAMTVIHYESSMDKVDYPFMAALGIQPDGFDRSILARRLNRSLTQYETDILREVIRRTGAQVATNLAALLISKRPQLKQDWATDAEVIETLRLRHGEDIAWLNGIFFGGDSVVNLVRGTHAENVQSELSADDRQAIDRDVVGWCLTQLESSQDAAATFIAGRLAQIDWRNIGHPALPGDFDPIAYLLLNVDVLKSGRHPCEHYIAYGRHAPGRRWRW